MNVINPYRHAAAVTPPSAIPFAYYRFEGNANDVTGNHDSDYQLNMSYPTTDLPPFGTHVAEFDRTLPSIIRIPDAAIMTPNNITGFSWSWWIKGGTIGGAQQNITKRNLSAAEYQFIASSTTLQGELYSENSTSTKVTRSNTGIFSETLWVHLVMTYKFSGGSFSWCLYKDGSLREEITSEGSFVKMNDTGSPVYLGNDRGLTGVSAFRNLTGKMAGVAFFNSQLTAAQVLEIYNYQNAGNHLL